MKHHLELIYQKVAEHKLSKVEALGLIEGLMNKANCQLHPLLHVNTSDFSGQRFTTTLKGDAFFLRDHVVNGQKVLPAVAYLEMVRAALAHSRDSETIELRNTVWLRPLIVTDAPKEIHIRLDVEDDHIAFQIYEQTASPDEPMVYCQGFADVGEIDEPQTPELQALRTEIHQEALNAEATYAAFEQVGITYGAGHRAIEILYRKDDQVLAKLTLPEAVRSQDEFQLHPSMMDGALQAVIALSMGAVGEDVKPSLPFALDAFEVFGAWTLEMWAWIRQSNDAQGKISVDVFDDAGKLSARFKGLTSRVLEGRQDISQLQALKLLQPVWQAVSPELKEVVDQRVLIIGGNFEQVDAVRSVYPNAEHLALQNEDAASIAAQLPQAIDHLIWIVPDRDDTVIEAQDRGVLQVFRIVKALFSHNYGVKDLAVTLITNQSVAVRSTDRIQPTHAGVHGLAGSLAKEYPHWRVRVLDLEADQPWPVANMFRIPANAEGDVYARRGDAWFAQALQPADVQTLQSSPYRTKGVYVVIGGAGGIGEAWSHSVIAKYDAHVIWLGRRAEADLAQAQRHALAHANLSYLQADATDLASLQRAYQSIKAEHGSIHGVIHSALTLEDRSLAKMEEAHFRKSFAAKVDISVHMAKVFQAEPLDFMLFFSSMNAFAKAPGQSNYAAGCTFEDAFAQQLVQTLPFAVKTMNWGFWGSVGVAADEAHNQRMASVGVGSIEPEEGMLALETLLQSSLSQLAAYKEIEVVQAVEDEAPHEVSGDSLVEKATAYFRDFIASALKIPANRIDPAKPLENYGLDSILSVQLTNGLSKHFDNLSSTLFFEVPTINALVEEMMRTQKDALIRQVGSQTATPAKAKAAATTAFKHPQPPRKTTKVEAHEPQAPRVASKEVAIIGLTGRFPQADDLATLWDNLVQGKDAIAEVPADRWDVAATFDEAKQTPGKSYSKWGGFLSDVAGFDPLFFNISPREAQMMDPKERLFLETVWNLLEGQGYTRPLLFQKYQRRVGVYVGAMYQQYHAFDADLMTESVVSLSSYSSIANRVSNFFDFQGPSIALDTMCSSSLTAIKMACESLLNGESKLAIAGGVNLSIHPKKYIGLSASSMIGSHPQSRSFADGDGYLPAEAVGAVLLKPLAQAEADGDHILAVIKSATANHGGAGAGWSIPNPNAQIQLMRDNFEQSGIDPRTISYLESAANGSPLGDPIEINALNRYFKEMTSDRGFCAIGAVKANIGHAEAASGISQLAKVLLQLQHKQIAPSIKGPLNPKIHFEDSPFYLPQEATTWEQPELEIEGVMRKIPRRAAISSFGAAGSNAHLIIEEYDAEVAAETPVAPEQPFVIPLSARSEDRLPIMCANLLKALHAAPKPLAEVAYTLQLHREAMDVRLAFVVESFDELLLGLEQIAEGVEHQVLIFRGNIEDAANNLLSGETGKLVLQSILKERNLVKVAEYWTYGGEIPWAEFHEGPQRPLVLPTYPFAKRRYWIPDGDTASEISLQPTQEKDWRDWLKRNAGSLLHIEDIPTRKSLDSLGFGSLDGVQLKSAFEREFGVTAPIALFQGSQTLEDISRDLQEIAPFEQTFATSETAKPEILPVIVAKPEDRFAPFPLSDIQESYLIGRKLGDKDDSVGCHIYLELEGTQELDLFRLNAAWKRLVEAHDMLRTVILPDGRQQVLQDTPPYEFKVLDLRRKSAAERELALQRVRDNLSHKVYDTDQWPLFDIRVSICPRGKAIIHFSIDELLLDWSGIQMLFAQWQTYYHEPERTLPQPQVTFRDYLVAVKKFERSERYQQDLDYWLTKLDRMPGAPTFSQQAAGFDPEHHERTTLAASLDQAQWRVLKEKAQALKVSPTTLLLCVFTEVLRVWNNGNPFSLIMTYFNRLDLHPDLDRVLGPFISTNLFLAKNHGDKALHQIISDTQTELWQNLDHGNVSGIRVMRELKKHRKFANNLSLPVVFTSLLGQDSQPQQTAAFADITYSVTQTPQVYLDHQVHERDGMLHFNWDVVKAYFAPGVVDGLFADYCAVLQQLAAQPEQFNDGTWRAAVRQKPLIKQDKLLQARPAQAFEPFPLTDQQQAYAYGRSKFAGNISSQVYMDFEAQDLNLSRLKTAWSKVMDTHEILRVVIQNDGTQQVLKALPPFEISVVDLRGKQREDVEKRLEAVRKDMLAKLPPLGSWPYFDIRVSRLDETKCRVHISIDMIIADGTSINMLAEALFFHYEHPDAPLKRRAVSFRDYVMHLQDYRKTEGFHVSTRYWRDKFEDIPPGPDLPTYAGVTIKATERFEGVLDGWTRIQRTADKLGVGPGIVLLAVYAEILGAWSERKPFSLVVPCWKRLDLHPELDTVVGDFTAMSWVTADLADKPFEAKVRGYHRILETDLSHMAVSGLSVLRKVAMKHKNRSFGFPVVFTNLAQPNDFKMPKGFKFGKFMSQTSQVHIDCISQEHGDQLNLHWDVAKGLFPPGMIAEMFSGYQRMLEALTDGVNWRKTNFDALIGARPDKFMVADSSAMEKVL